MFYKFFMSMSAKCPDRRNECAAPLVRLSTSAIDKEAGLSISVGVRIRVSQS